jgi:hypothetical protein
MATVKKIKKAQDGYMGKKAPKDSVYTESGRLISKKENDAWQKETTKAMNDQFFSRPENKKFAPKKAVKAAPKKKMKDGGAVAFKALAAPKDKATFADKIAGAKKAAGKAKSGAKMKTCKYGC